MFIIFFKWVKKSIVNQFTLIMVAGTIVPVLFVSIVSYVITEKIIYENSFRSIQKNLNALTQSVDNMRYKFIALSDGFYYNRKLVEMMEKEYNGTNPVEKYEDDNYIIREVFNPLASSFNYQSYFFIFTDKNEMHTNLDVRTRNLTYGELKDRLDRKYLSRVDRNSYNILWLSTEKELFEKDMLTFARPLKDRSGNTVGVLLFFVDNQIFIDLFANMEYSGEDEVMITDGDGNIISHVSPSLIGRNTNQILGRSLPSPGKYSFATLSGSKKLVSSVNLPKSEWLLINAVPTGSLLNRMEIIRNTIVFSILFIGFLTMLLEKIVLNKTTRSLKYLRRKVEEISRGNLDTAIALKGEDEVAQLGMCLDDMLTKIKQLIEDAVEQQKLNAELEIKAYQSQLNPHFLFNTLNNIKWIALAQQQDQIASMISSLGNILESAMRNRVGMVRVKEEIDLLKNYIEIQKFRYKDKFEVHFYIDAAMEELMIPNLILQPVIENSTFHGIGRKPFIDIDIHGELEGDQVVFKVMDNGCGIPEEKLRTLLQEQQHQDANRIGIMSIKKRIGLKFGSQYGIHILSNTGEGTEVVINLPIIKEPV